MSKFLHFSKKTLAVVMALTLALSAFSFGFTAEAVSKKKAVKSIKVAKKKVTLTAKKSTSVKVTVKGGKKANKKFTVKSANTKVATAKVSGGKVKITAKNVTKKMTTKITVTTKGKNKRNKRLKATITVTVNPVKKSTPAASKPASQTPQTPQTPALERINVSSSASSISVGGTAQLNVESATSGASISRLEFSSSNDYIATVNSLGIVSGQHGSPAPVTITVRAYDARGNVATATISITVIETVSATISGIDSTAVLYVGATKQLNPIAVGAEPSFSYISTNESVATVDSNGVVTAVSEGVANIVVTLNGTNATAVCAVTVRGAALGILGFGATHASVLTVRFTMPVSEADRGLVNITLKKGNSVLTPVVSWAENGKVVDLTMDSELEATGYSVSIDSNDVSIDSARSYAVCEVEKLELKKIQITSTRIPKANGAKLYFDALDNYGDPMKNITADKFEWTFASSRASVDMNQLKCDFSKAEYVVLNNLSELENLVVDETTFRVMAEWKENPRAINTTAEVSIASLNVQHIEIDSIVEGTIYENTSDKTYTLKYNATDQYGSPIDWSIFVNGAYNNPFTATSSNEELVSAPEVFEGKLVIVVNANQHGKATISIRGNDLITDYFDIEVREAPKPQRLLFSNEDYALIANDSKDVKIPVSFTDQYGSVMSQGAVTQAIYRREVTASSPMQGLTIGYETGTEGDFIVLNSNDVDEPGTARIYFSTYDDNEQRIDSTYTIRVNEARKASTIHMISEVPKELVNGEEITLQYEVLDNHGDVWTKDDVIVSLITTNKYYLELERVTLDEGKGVMVIKAIQTSYQQGSSEASLQFELRNEDTEALISLSSEYPIVVYDNVEEIKFNITSSETQYKSGQTINVTLTAYNNKNVLTTYNQTYTDVLFTELTDTLVDGGTQYKDVVFVNGVATVQLQVLRAGTITYNAQIPAKGRTAMSVNSSSSIKVVPSDASYYSVELEDEMLVVTCYDLNGNVKTDYVPAAGTYVYLESENAAVKAEGRIATVASDGKTNASFENGVLILDQLSFIPSGTVIRVTTGNITGSYTVK